MRIRLLDRYSARIALVCSLLVAGLAMCALTVPSLARSRENHQRRAEVAASNLCTVISDNLLAAYEKIDLALLGARDEVERQLRSGRIDPAALEAFLQRQRARAPILYSLRITSAEGIVEHGDLPPGPRADLSDREYFRRLQADPRAGMVFSKPLMGRVRPVWSLILARRINRPDGSFGGVVYGSIELANLSARVAALGLGQEGDVALRDADLAVIVRRGGRGDATGETAVSKEFRALLQAGRASGTYTAATGVDGVERIHAFRKLEPYGHYLHVGLGVRDVFEPWRRELVRTSALAAFAFLVLGASTWMGLRALNRRQQAEVERERVILDLQRALAEVRTLSGLLPICSGCKKVRDDGGYWNQIESYIATHSQAQFTHGLCPDCVRMFFPDLQDLPEKRDSPDGPGAVRGTPKETL